MKTKSILLSACIAMLLASPALCQFSFTVERTDDGSTGTWVYTLRNDCGTPVSLDSWGVFGATATSLAGVDPAPSGWSVSTDGSMGDPSWQVIWASGFENVPDVGDAVPGFTIERQDPRDEGAAPTQFTVWFYDGLDPLDFTGDIQTNGVPEPSTAAALATAFPCLGIAAFRRRRSGSNH